jgi:hypothetical protein
VITAARILFHEGAFLRHVIRIVIMADIIILTKFIRIGVQACLLQIDERYVSTRIISGHIYWVTDFFGTNSGFLKRISRIFENVFKVFSILFTKRGISNDKDRLAVCCSLDC